MTSAPPSPLTATTRRGALTAIGAAAVAAAVRPVSADDAPASPALRKLLDQPVIRLDWFDCPGDGREVSANVKRFFGALAERPQAQGFVTPGVHGLDASAGVLIADGLSLTGAPGGASVFRRVGGTYPMRSAYNRPAAAMIALGDAATGKRYGVEQSRLPSGQGATFALDFSGSAPELGVRAARVVSGGDGYKAKDLIRLDGGAVLKVETVARHRGPVTAVSVSKPGRFAAAIQGPASQTGSIGMSIQDRIIDPASFARTVAIRDVVFDGADPGAPLSPGQLYYGLSLLGVRSATVERCVFRGLPNTGLMLEDVQNATVLDCLGEHCGWTGVEKSSRNAFSNTGIYLTKTPELNTTGWRFERNVARDIGDVGCQIAYVAGGLFAHNTITGCVAIGFEGEASSYAVLDTAATNGGVNIPSDYTIVDNVLDGRLKDGSLGFVWGAISLADGNEGSRTVARNTIRHAASFAIKARQTDGGRLTLDDNVIEDVNAKTPDRRPVDLQAASVAFRRNSIRNAQNAPVVLAVVGRDADISSNTIADTIGGRDVVIQLATAGPTIERVAIDDNVLTNCPAGGVGVSAIAASVSPVIARLSISRNAIQDYANAGSAAPGISVLAGKGAALTVAAANIDGNTLKSVGAATSAVALAVTPNSAGISVAGNTASGASAMLSVNKASPNAAHVQAANNRML